MDDFDLRVSGTARFTGGDNEHGYRAGNRYAAFGEMTRWFGPSWSAGAGLVFSREEAETWSGEVEHEGNLGRSDLLVSLGVTRAGTPLGTVHAGVLFPVHSHAREHQTEIPLVLRVGWSP